MTATRIAATERAAARNETPVTLVWIDTDDALIVRWDGSATIERVTSDVPPRHRSTGHVRHDPEVRHGGGGPPTDRLERDRKRRLERFIEQVATRVPPAEAVHIVGPGVVRKRLGRVLRAEDRRLGRDRTVDSGAAAQLTERQLVADIRTLSGDPAPRMSDRDAPR